ncbi:MAG: hypothetical protein Unbinned2706contig1001_37 [Prokaryotic dsDNA virus sp.]|nr:MAG: hypothetical protein Unbinned2706contig1001_37 [Prokaryotic dsDNA virus sp.]|tara:strand:+ start:10132 stop:10458 length:327 start_codon:yes stop_codon:yes gene_type:complete
MSSEVYAVKIPVPASTQTFTTSDEHFGAVVSILLVNNRGASLTLASIKDANGLDIVGNHNPSALSNGSTAQIVQTEMGGTAVAGTLTVDVGGTGGSSGTFDVYVYIAP